MIKKPFRTSSKILRSFFNEMEHCGIPANVYHPTKPRRVVDWKSGKHTPSVLMVEEMLDLVGYELILRKKET